MKKIPKGYHAVTPWIIARGVADLLEFMKNAFCAVETEGSRMTGEDGLIGHVETKIGDAVIMAFDAKTDWPDTPAFLRLYVEDGDATYQRALDAGATSVTKMTDLFFGDRVGRVRDRWGNIWWIHEHIEDVDGDEMQQRMQDPQALAAMKYVQDSLVEAMRRGRER